MLSAIARATPTSRIDRYQTTYEYAAIIPAHTMGTIRPAITMTPPTAAIPPGITSKTTPNIIADNNFCTVITMFVSRPTMARVATIPSDATAAAAPRASPTPTRACTLSPDPLDSTAISAAPATATVTPSH